MEKDPKMKSQVSEHGPDAGREPSLGDTELVKSIQAESTVPEREEGQGEAFSGQPPEKIGKEPKKRPAAVVGIIGEFFGLLAVLAVPLNLLAVGLVGAALVIQVASRDLPDTEMIRDLELQEPLRIYAADGSLIAEFGIQRRSPVAFEEIPALLVNAFLATEDSRFFEHQGIDIVGLSRAALQLVMTGTKAQGGSTITMQLTRDVFLSPEKTYMRKLKELLLALHVEKSLSKQEILELYLNKIFFGHRAYGISAAAELYYGQSLDKISTAQMAMLAGLPKAPSTNNPVTNPVRALERRNYILSRMRDLGYIGEDEYAVSVNQPDDARLHRREVDLEAGYIAEMVRQQVTEKYGDAAYRMGLAVTTTVDSRLQRAVQDALRSALRQYDYRHGYRGPEAQVVDIVAASLEDMDAFLSDVVRLPKLDPGLVVSVDGDQALVYMGYGEYVNLGLSQVKWAREFKNPNWRGPAPRKVSDAVGVGDLIRLRQDDKGVWQLSQAPEVSGSLVGLDPKDGGILALSGGYEFKYKKFNHAVDMRRQPGSSFKPFIYAAALDKGWTPASLVKDEPVRLKGGRAGEVWVPKNFDHKTMGPIRIRVALAKSRNLAAINLLGSMGIDHAHEYVKRFGFDFDRSRVGLSMALGTAEVSPLQMAAGYAVFANGGYRVEPHLISGIRNAAGEILFEHQGPRACSDCWAYYPDAPASTQGTEPAELEEPVIDPRIAYQMTSLLREVVENGTAVRAKKLGRSDIVGKTGTTNDERDSWFCGFQKDLVTVAWMGKDTNEKLGKGETGGRAALGMWMQFVGEALENKPEAVLDPPEGMVTVRIDKRRGTNTKSRGSHTMEEIVREEYELMLLGPQPVKFAGSRKPRRKAARARPRAPRVVDDLF